MNTHAKAVTTTEYFGGCPECGGNHGYRNAGNAHFAFCDIHRTRWLIGVNLFSSWQEETEDEQRAAWHLDGYCEVKPIMPPLELYAWCAAEGIIPQTHHRRGGAFADNDNNEQIPF